MICVYFLLAIAFVAPFCRSWTLFHHSKLQTRAVKSLQPLQLSDSVNDQSETVVYLSNVEYSVTEEILRSLLEDNLQFKVGKISIPKDKFTSKFDFIS